MTQLEGTENRITVERMRFNEVAREYNTRLAKFPTNLFVRILGWHFQTPAVLRRPVRRGDRAEGRVLEPLAKSCRSQSSQRPRFSGWRRAGAAPAALSWLIRDRGRRSPRLPAGAGAREAGALGQRPGGCPLARGRGRDRRQARGVRKGAGLASPDCDLPQPAGKRSRWRSTRSGSPRPGGSGAPGRTTAWCSSSSSPTAPFASRSATDSKGR